ncbi:hypothetical protein BDN72DRAFT_306059 [Pluteus cervinus]|uniref:Uncharacterized protein n=1 Tax=Pluteus cervinus TaxID=181527 RepID=A0ACD3ADJ3_9AGAR|nr:hypothetical protein BDN72DRAFT_306059 [Pluteus cervinus]
MLLRSVLYIPGQGGMRISPLPDMTLLHLIYIHGFQGSEANFQAFPNDVHQYLCAHLPPNSPFTIKSSIYPRYKTEKPLVNAVRNFLEWLALQPPGLVILLGHSMGGLLAAEVVFGPNVLIDNVTQPQGDVRPQKVIGIIAFDTPYLGVHPHVAKSSISALLLKSGKKNNDFGEQDPKVKAEHSDDSDESKNERGRGKAEEVEARLNPNVDIVDRKVTDDWEGVKRSWGVSKHFKPFDATQTTTAKSQTTDPSLSDRFKAASTSLLQKLNFSSPPALSHRSHSSPTPLTTSTSEDSMPPMSPVGSAFDTFQFAAAVLDPLGLNQRYDKLVKWHPGRWVNYFTESHVGSAPSSLPTDEVHSTNPHDGTSSKAVKKARHFILLPTGFGLRSFVGGSDMWEKLVVVNAKSEVHGHCLMFRRKNLLDYDDFVEKVGRRALLWADEEITAHPVALAAAPPPS